MWVVVAQFHILSGKYARQGEGNRETPKTDSSGVNLNWRHPKQTAEPETRPQRSVKLRTIFSMYIYI
jgi:hypothetical protein